MKRIVSSIIILLLSVVCKPSDSIFVVSGIAYRILDDRTVNVTSRDDEKHYTQMFPDSLLDIPSEVNYDGSAYAVKGIEKGAFVKHTGIKRVVIHNGVEEIQDNCFSGCANIQEINIPASVRILGNDLFAFCISLKRICVNKKNIYFDSREDCNAIIRKRDNSLIYGCKATVIPSTIKSINTHAYYGCMIEKVMIPEGVEHLYPLSFSSCPILRDIYIPSSMDTIDCQSFLECPCITSIKVSHKNKKYDSRNDCNAIINTEMSTLVMGCVSTVIPSDIDAIGEYAFAYCVNLQNIVVPNGISSINESAFLRCSALKTVSLPLTLEEFKGGSQFGYCQSLESIYIPKNVERVPCDIFVGCMSLKEITVDVQNKTYDSRNGCNAIVESSTDELIAGCAGSVIVDGIKSIGDYSFRKSGITSIYIPSSVTNISSTAFIENNLCSSISVSNDNPYYTSNGPNSIVERNTNKLVLACRTTTLLPGITHIGDYAFVNASATVIIPEGVKSIGMGSFCGCKELQLVIVPRSVETIGRFAFDNCEKLSHLIMMGGRY